MITDKKVWDKSREILELMSTDMTIGQFLDALLIAQCTIIAQAADYTAIRECADEIKDKVIANSTYIKEKYIDKK